MTVSSLTSWLNACWLGLCTGWLMFGDRPKSVASTAMAHSCLALIFAIKPRLQVQYTQHQVDQNQSFRSTSLACHTEYRSIHIHSVQKRCNAVIEIAYIASMMIPVNNVRGSDCVLPLLLTMMCTHSSFAWLYGFLAMLCATHVAQFSALRIIQCLQIWISTWLGTCVQTRSAIHVCLSMWYFMQISKEATLLSALDSSVVAVFACGVLRTRPSIFTGIWCFFLLVKSVCVEKIHYV